MDTSNIKPVLISLGAMIIIVAGGIFLAGRAGGPIEGNSVLENVSIDIPTVQADDHIIGNSDANVVLVEYSDTECPFCKDFHGTLNTVVEEYESDEFAWVYRHFPLNIHPKAKTEAIATECAAELGGEDGFWNYINRLYEVTPSNNNLDLNLLSSIAEEVGLNASAFTTCLDEERYEDHVEQETEEALSSGGTGTPYSVLLLKNPLTDSTVQGIKDLAQGAPTGFIRISEDKTKVALAGGLPEGLLTTLIDTLLTE